MTKIQKRAKEFNEQLKNMLNNPRYIIYYKGKEVRRYAFYGQAVAYCIKHNRYCSEEKVSMVDLETGEECVYESLELSLF